MALQTEMSVLSQSGNSAQTSNREGTAKTAKDIDADMPTSRDEDVPSYLVSIRALQAVLTEEEKEAIHLSFQG